MPLAYSLKFIRLFEEIHCKIGDMFSSVFEGNAPIVRFIGFEPPSHKYVDHFYSIYPKTTMISLPFKYTIQNSVFIILNDVAFAG